MDLSNMFFLLANEESPVIVGGSDSSNTNATTGDTSAQSDGGTTADTAGTMSPIVMIVVWVAVIGIFYFISIRPQRKREKKAKEMQESMKVGDNVVTSGGLYGKIMDVGEDCFIVEFGTNRGVRVPVRKSDILGIKAPTLTPVKHDEKDNKDAN